ncbi:MAG: VOC family protein [Sodalis sp. (in: enterobacteria)]|uniref:VOC family protein n=1 Tax=Sodalis sp. (in: enterobacteria) TaxID=1898979 RepID=UPI0039E69783
MRLYPHGPQHAGTSEADGKIVPWGSGNHCAMFAQGYFEIIGLMDADMPSNVKKMVERYEGLHIVAMQCPRADDAYPLLIDAGVPALKVSVRPAPSVNSPSSY